jgi:hypothetical protein
MLSSGILRRVALVRTDVSEELSAYINHRSPILVTLMMEEIHYSETRFLQEPHGVTSQKTTFSIVIAVKTLKSYIALTGCAL